MRILDAGHIYLLDSLDGGTEQQLTFVKREGDNFPFNQGSHSGTNCQEVLRALIDRTRYLLSQKPCMETEQALHNLESALAWFEVRAARRHNRHLDLYSAQQLVCAETCRICRHVGCKGHYEEHADQPNHLGPYDLSTGN